MGVLCLVLVLLLSTLCPSFHLDGEEGAGCFTLTVFLMSYDSQCSVTLPRGTMGWYTVYDCGIS